MSITPYNRMRAMQKARELAEQQAKVTELAEPKSESIIEVTAEENAVIVEVIGPTVKPRGRTKKVESGNDGIRDS